MNAHEQFGSMTVADYWQQAGGGFAAPIKDWNGWYVEKHNKGLCVTSPRTSIQELGYPDNSNEILANILAQFDDKEKGA